MAAKELENAIFVSYAWGGESERTVDELQAAFTARGLRMVRDKKDLGYKGSIEAFEQRIGAGQCIVLVISDKYLRSEHCMYELVEIAANQALRERIFPIVLADARIYKAIERLAYIRHWDEQIEQLNQAIKEVRVVANLAGIAADLDKYTRIRANFDHLADLLSDMNALTPEMHAASGYVPLIDAVERARSGGTSRQPERGTAASLEPGAPGAAPLSQTAGDHAIQIGQARDVQINYVASGAAAPEADRSAPALNSPVWSISQKRAVVEALLACPSMSNHQARDQIVSELPSNIRNAIARSDAARPDVANILTACLNYPHGLQALLAALDFYEAGSTPYQQLKSMLT